MTPTASATSSTVRPRSLRRSQALWEQAQRLIPCGTQTLSKGPNQFIEGVYPIYLERGQGSHVFDVDGNEYIDFPLALGPVLLGYNHPAVNEAIARQLQDGITFSLMHPLEVEVAALIADLVPCAEMVRFAKTGSEVTSAALRVARAATGRTHVAFCGYHGWHDWYAVQTSRAKGCAEPLRQVSTRFTYNDLSSLERVFAEHPGDVAAVIMEPVVFEPPRDGFLQQVADLAHRHGAVLIFDEIVTGFRFARGGAQELYGVTPDLACFGKACANGMPLNLLVGRRALMRECEEVFFSSTFAGETLSLAAAKATLETLQREPVIEHIWTQGRRFQEAFKAMALEHGIDAEFAGLPPRQTQVFRDAAGQASLLYKGFFWQEAVKRGVLFGGAQNVSWAHTTADIDTALQVCQAALRQLQEAVAAGVVAQRLEGPLPVPVFR